MILFPVRYVEREGVILDANNKVLLHVFARREDSWAQTIQRGKDLCEALNLAGSAENVKEKEPTEPVAVEEKPKAETPAKKWGNPWGRAGKPK